MNETVSIIIPIYNGEAYIDPCVENLVKQSYDQIEIILVDDGSEDDSLKKCMMWERKDGRVHVFSQKNKGVGAARNLGLENSTGSYIGFVDIDDICDLEMYSRMVQIMAKDDADIVYCGYNRCFLSENRVKCQYGKLSGPVDRIEAVKQLKSVNYDCGAWNKLFRRKVILETGGGIRKFSTEYPIGEDYLWMLYTLKGSNKISLLQECLYNYNMIQGSASHSLLLDKKNLLHLYALRDCIRVARTIREDLGSDPMLRLYGQARILRLLAYCKKNTQYMRKINELIQSLDCESTWFWSKEVSKISKMKQTFMNCVYKLGLDGKYALWIYNLKRRDKLCLEE